MEGLDHNVRQLQNEYAQLNATPAPLLAEAKRMSDIERELSALGAEIDWNLCEALKRQMQIPDTPFNSPPTQPMEVPVNPDSTEDLAIRWLNDLGIQDLRPEAPSVYLPAEYAPRIVGSDVMVWIVGAPNALLSLFDHFDSTWNLPIVVAMREFSSEELHWADANNGFGYEIALYHLSDDVFVPANDLAVAFVARPGQIVAAKKQLWHGRLDSRLLEYEASQRSSGTAPGPSPATKASAGGCASTVALVTLVTLLLVAMATIVT